MASHKMPEKFDLKILEKIGNQTHTNSDYTKEQLTVIIDRIEALKSPISGLKNIMLVSECWKDLTFNTIL